MKLVTRVAVLLIMCVVLVAATQKGGTATREECLAKCKANCTKSYEACIKSGKNEKQCVGSRDVCNAVCANKTCPPPQQPKK